MDAEAVRTLLRSATKQAGGVYKWARENNIPGPLVSQILNYQRGPTPQVLVALGVKRVTDYQVIEGEVTGEGEGHEPI
jgi:hypothetical protein